MQGRNEVTTSQINISVTTAQTNEHQMLQMMEINL